MSVPSSVGLSHPPTRLSQSRFQASDQGKHRSSVGLPGAVVSSGQSGYRLPRTVRDSGVGARAVACYLLLRARSNAGRVTVSLETLTRAVGSSARSTDATSAAVTELLHAGFVRARQSRPDRARTYRVRTETDLGGRYDVVPHDLLAALTRGDVSPATIRAWCHVDQALGARGWTIDTTAALAARMGVSARTVTGHVAALAELGVLVVSGDRTARMMSRPAAQMPVLDEPVTAEPAEAKPGSVRKQNRGHKEVAPEHLAPEHLAPEHPSPSALVAAPHQGDAPGRDGRERPKGDGRRSGVASRRDVREVLERLAGEWTSGGARRWRGGLGSVLASHLDAGVPGAVLVRALNDRADV